MTFILYKKDYYSLKETIVLQLKIRIQMIHS